MAFDLKSSENIRDLKHIDKIILHCSDSDNPEHDNIATIKQWHLERKFSDCGYHFFIRSTGQIETGRALYKIGAHCIGQNLKSIGICLSGKTNFTEAQFKSAYQLIKGFMDRFNIPKDAVFPHNHFDKKKTCPNFQLDEIWKFDNNDVK